jgi:hypothetical protein
LKSWEPAIYLRLIPYEGVIIVQEEQIIDEIKSMFRDSTTDTNIKISRNDSLFPHICFPV